MSKIVCVTSIEPLGCTFLDWSILFLSGCQKFYQTDIEQFVPLVSDPVTQINAHQHQKNQCSGYQNTVQLLKKLKLINSDCKSFYPFPLNPGQACVDLNISEDQVAASWPEVYEYIQNDYRRLLQELATDPDVQLIFVECSPELSLYNKLSQRAQDVFGFANLTNTYPDSTANKQAEIDRLFFQDNTQWLDNIWDQRERRALNTRWFDYKHFDVDYRLSMLRLHGLELMWMGENALNKTMRYLNRPILNIDHWNTVYSKWQKIHIQTYDFVLNFDHIMRCIISGHSYQLPELTLDQEVLIQHCLIYQHNLNLKTWKLEKFTNTKQLHDLLEPNIHDLTALRLTA
jgi:hypothetical protein